jgi:ABC-2 type transport system permease protein
MGAWQLELLRTWRTRRLIALAAAFLLLGLGIPLLTYFLPEIIKGSARGVQITVPRQTAADAITGFAGNTGQLGTLVVVVVSAASMSIDAHPALAAFYRTRLRGSRALVLPRYVTVTAASLLMLALGTLAALYETNVLFGAVPIGALMVGIALEGLWFCFVTSVVACFTSVMRSVLGVVGLSIAMFLALALLEGLPAAFSWLPTRLAASGADLIHHPAGDVWHAAVVTALATLSALGIGMHRLGHRES